MSESDVPSNQPQLVEREGSDEDGEPLVEAVSYGQDVRGKSAFGRWHCNTRAPKPSTSLNKLQ